MRPFSVTPTGLEWRLIFRDVVCRLVSSNSSIMMCAGLRGLTAKHFLLKGLPDEQVKYVSFRQKPTYKIARSNRCAFAVQEKSIPQIEIAVGEQVKALPLRILAPLSSADEKTAAGVADQYGNVFYLQPKGPASAYRFYPLDKP